MNVKKFEKIAKFISVLLKIGSIVIFVGITGLIVLLIFKRDNLILSSPTPTFPISTIRGNVTAENTFIATIVVAFPAMFSYLYTFFRGSQLAKGDTPFSISNYTRN